MKQRHVFPNFVSSQNADTEGGRNPAVASQLKHRKGRALLILLLTRNLDFEGWRNVTGTITTWCLKEGKKTHVFIELRYSVRNLSGRGRMMLQKMACNDQTRLDFNWAWGLWARDLRSTGKVGRRGRRNPTVSSARFVTNREKIYVVNCNYVWRITAELWSQGPSLDPVQLPLFCLNAYNSW